jgi:hypothetical protein
METDIKLLVPYQSGLVSCQGLKSTIQLAYGRLVVLLRCLLVTEIMDEAAPVWLVYLYYWSSYDDWYICMTGIFVGLVYLYGWYNCITCVFILIDIFVWQVYLYGWYICIACEFNIIGIFVWQVYFMAGIFVWIVNLL